MNYAALKGDRNDLKTSKNTNTIIDDTALENIKATSEIK